MPTVPMLPSSGVIQSLTTEMGAGVGFFSLIDLGLPVGTTIPVEPGRVDSNPLLVSGFNAFMLAIVTFPIDVNVYVSHCDPTTNAILVTQQVDTATHLLPGTAFYSTFGAFSLVISANTVGQSWNVIRVGLAAPVAGPFGQVVGGVDQHGLFCGTR